MRLTIDVAGRRFTVELAAQRARPDDVDVEVPPQGATSGELERRPGWDHDEREPIGFSGRRRYGYSPEPDGKPKPPPPVGPGCGHAAIRDVTDVLPDQG